MSAAGLVYLVLGPSGGRRLFLVADLIGAGLDKADPVCVCVPKGGVKAAALEQLKPLGERVQVLEWAMVQGQLQCDEPPLGSTVFFISDGRKNPVDQVEAFSQWLPSLPHEMGSVMTVVDCAKAVEHNALLKWYDACIHFSDAVLLNKREGVEQRWIRDFLERYQKAGRYPCYFEQVKKNRISKPAEVLDPTPRRISLVFEPSEDPLDDMEFDEENLPEEPFDLIGKADPFFERLPSGIRAKIIPDIAKYL